MIGHFKYVAAHTTRTPKITIPAPSAIYGRPVATPIDKSIYPELGAFFEDLGKAYRKAVRAFADAGCRYLQLDEVFIAMLCDPKYRRQMTAATIPRGSGSSTGISSTPRCRTSPPT